MRESRVEEGTVVGQEVVSNQVNFIYLAPITNHLNTLHKNQPEISIQSLKVRRLQERMKSKEQS